MTPDKSHLSPLGGEKQKRETLERESVMQERKKEKNISGSKKERERERDAFLERS